MTEVWVYIILGLVTGLLGGMLGVGGGVIVIPALALVLPAWDLTPDQPMSFLRMLCFVSNALVSGAAILRFRKLGLWPPADFKLVLAGMAGGTLLGAFWQSQLNEQAVKMCFAFFAAYVGLNMLISAWRNPVETEERIQSTKKVPLVSAGFPAGVFCGVLGIGGGGLLVPLLNLLAKVPLRRAIIVSHSCIFVVSLLMSVAVLLPAHLDGRISLLNQADNPAFIAFLMAPGIILGVRFGARLSQNFPLRGLKLVFSALLLYTCLKMGLG